MPDYRPHYRVSDGFSHAESFTAARRTSFLAGLLDALQRFRDARPHHRNRLWLHAWDGEDWTNVRLPSMAPIAVTSRDVMRNADMIWEAARDTSISAQGVHAQLGGLLDWLHRD